MPRQARLDAPGALHHIMVRGIDKSNIFRDAQDKARFLERLGQNILNAKCSVYAWVPMDNHVHLLFKSGKDGISSVMRKLLTWYAHYFNHRYNRTGHLFQNRYKSILCDEENYLLALIRYIHLNPVRAKVVKTIEELDRYPWSGHSAIIGKTKHPWMDSDTVLSQFGGRKSKALTEYRRFVVEEFGSGRNPELTGGGLIRSQGGWSRVLALQRSGNAGGGSRRRKVSKKRAHIALRCREEIGCSGAEIARHLGVNTTSIDRAVERAGMMSSG